MWYYSSQKELSYNSTHYVFLLFAAARGVVALFFFSQEAVSESAAINFLETFFCNEGTIAEDRPPLFTKLIFFPLKSLEFDPLLPPPLHRR